MSEVFAPTGAPAQIALVPDAGTLREYIDDAMAAGTRPMSLARSIYDSNFNAAFQDREDVLQRIRDELGTAFGVSLADVLITGSAKFGFSLSSGRPFRRGESDLDVALVNARLFETLASHVLGSAGKAPAQAVQRELEAGIIRLEVIPEGPHRDVWMRALASVHERLREEFSAVSVTLFRSRRHFLAKQAFALSRNQGSRAFFESLTNAGPHRPVGPLDVQMLRDLAHADFPAFLRSVDLSYPYDSSPFQFDLNEALHEFALWPGRECLTATLEGFLIELQTLVRLQFLLIGGSFLRLSFPTPADVDTVVYYSLSGIADPAIAAKLKELACRYRYRGVDARFIPVDVEPALLVKMTSFFTNLYSSSRQGGPLNGAALLLP